MNYGFAFKTIRSLLGMTQGSFARELLGRDNAYLSNVERGRQRPSILVIEKLSKELNIHPWVIHTLAAAGEIEGLTDAKTLETVEQLAGKAVFALYRKGLSQDHGEQQGNTDTTGPEPE